MYYLFSSFFFFKQKTAYEMRISDWSSDVCSSDLPDALSQNYANYVTPNPSAAAQQAAIIYAADGLLNYTDGPYDPQAVRYLIDNRNTNVAAQKIEGVDQIGRASGRARVCKYV